MRERWGVVAALAIVLATFSACGDDEVAPESEPSATASSDQPDGAGSALPDCTEVWQDGETLPADYSGCVADGEPVAAKRQRCASGQVLVTYADRYYAAAGQVINDVGELASSKAYQRAERACDG